jgi:hypothetical protein
LEDIATFANIQIKRVQFVVRENGRKLVMLLKHTKFGGRNIQSTCLYSKRNAEL